MKFKYLYTLFLTLGLTLGSLQAQSTPKEQRIVHLDGEKNFRDLGGYKTLDGESVKWGKLYRSGKLSELSDKDVKTLEALHIKTVVSFLIPKEIVYSGKDKLPKGTKEIALPIESGNAEDLTVIVAEARKTGDFSKVPTDFNPEIHRLIVDEAADEYAALIRAIIKNENIPLVFHCSHGVHRTGTAAAIILSLIGVPWETVRNDYLLSNKTREAQAKKRLQQLKELAAKNQNIPLSEVDTTNMNAFYILQGDYIDATKEEILKSYGSFHNYAIKKLKLSDDEIEQLKDVLLYQRKK